MPFPILAALGTMAGGIIGAVAKRRAEARNAARQDNQLQRLMEDARAAGIHPVAALGGANLNYGAPVADGSSPFGDAVGGAAQIASSAHSEAQGLALDNQRLQNERLSLEIQREQLMLQEATSRSLASQVLAMSRSPSSTVVEPPGPMVGGMTYPAMQPGGWEFLPATPQQVYENQYGEIGGELFGIGNLVRDWHANAVPVVEDYIREWMGIGSPQFGYNHPRRFEVFNQ